MEQSNSNLTIPTHISDSFNRPVIMKVVKGKKYADDFIAGKLYLNLNSFFADQENNKFLTEKQSDEYEGIGTYLRSTNEVQYYTKLIDGKPYVVEGSSTDNYSPGIPLITASLGVKDNTANIFCMYTVWFDLVNNQMTAIDEKIKDNFGDICIIVLDFNEFLNRVSKALFDSKYVYVSEPSYGWVEYVDCSQHHTRLGIFKKEISHMFQNEFRLCMQLDRNPAPLEYLGIGAMSDIVVSVTTEELLSSKMQDNIWIIGDKKFKFQR